MSFEPKLKENSDILDTVLFFFVKMISNLGETPAEEKSACAAFLETTSF